MVTRRIRPMKIDGKEMFQIGIPIHWGFRGIAEDEGKTAKTLTNQLTPTVIDPNAFTPEFKGFLVKIEKAVGGTGASRVRVALGTGDRSQQLE